MSDRQSTRDAIEILKHTFGIDPESDPEVQQFSVGIEVAESLLAAREAAGLSRQELAKLSGLSPTAIDQLEDGEYEGDSFSVLHRIAKSLNSRVEIRMVPSEYPAVAPHLQAPQT